MPLEVCRVRHGILADHMSTTVTQLEENDLFCVRDRVLTGSLRKRSLTQNASPRTDTERGIHHKPTRLLAINVLRTVEIVKRARETQLEICRAVFRMLQSKRTLAPGAMGIKRSARQTSARLSHVKAHGGHRSADPRGHRYLGRQVPTTGTGQEWCWSQ